MGKNEFIGGLLLDIEELLKERLPDLNHELGYLDKTWSLLSEHIRNKQGQLAMGDEDASEIT